MVQGAGEEEEEVQGTGEEGKGVQEEEQKQVEEEQVGRWAPREAAMNWR